MDGWKRGLKRCDLRRFKLLQTALYRGQELHTAESLPMTKQARFFAPHLPLPRLYKRMVVCLNTHDHHNQGLVRRLYP